MLGLLKPRFAAHVWAGKGSRSTAGPCQTRVLAFATQPAGDAPTHDEVLASRRTLERLVPQLRFNIAGVTFEGRQDLIKLLRPGQRVVLVKEPSNPYDPLAVRVQTLRGSALGYVPREQNSKFVHGIELGLVQGAGQAAESSAWGATVLAHPGLLPMLLDPLPSKAEAEVMQQFRETYTHDAKAVASALQAAQGSCEVTGIPLPHPPSPMPVWQWDVHSKEVRLGGIAVVHPMILQAKAALLGAVRSGATPSSEAATLMCDINSWSRDDWSEYLLWVQATQQQVDAQNWKVTL